MLLHFYLKIFFCINLILLKYQIKCGDINNNEVNDKFRSYEPTWTSLDTRPLPKWYNDAKIGIFIHWGVYSVPSLGGEWFWYDWEQNNSAYVEFMKSNYPPHFTYQDFAKDFTAELFNATEWALLFQKSGAKHVVLTSKHHDGYTLWPSSKSFNWNSFDVGPNRDIVDELSKAIRRNTKLKFGVYYSLFEWFNRIYINDKIHIFTQNDYVTQKVLPELHELFEKYEPEILWSDGDWEAFPDYWKSREFLAWLYNNSTVKNTVVTNDRWGIGVNCKHGDFFTCQDHFNPGILKEHKWENAFSIDKRSWGHRTSSKLNEYMTTEEIIKEIVTSISCNGNVLINVGPTKYGTIPPLLEERLVEMGEWLKINGEAIYFSKYWIYQNDTKTSNVWYTMKPNKVNRTTIYAMVLNYPFETNNVELESIFKGVDDRTSIKMLGLPNDIELNFQILDTSILILFPPKFYLDKYNLKYCWTLKIDLKTF